MDTISLELPLPAPPKRKVFIHRDGTREDWNGDPATIDLRGARSREEAARACSVLIRPNDNAIILDGYTV